MAKPLRGKPSSHLVARIATPVLGENSDVEVLERKPFQQSAYSGPTALSYVERKKSQLGFKSPRQPRVPKKRGSSEGTG